MEFGEVEAKSILVRSHIPGVDYVINSYIGCRFGCTYCYASFMGRMVGKDITDWGNYVYVKKNAVELLKSEMAKLKFPKKKKEQGIEIVMSTVTDPYQGVEAKYKLSRRCLEVLADEEFRGLISILTKSDLVVRDIDILKRLKRVEVGLTITSTDDEISRYFEKYAPGVTMRLRALSELQSAGIETYAFIGPLLPHYATRAAELENIIRSIAETGTREVYVEHINLRPYILQRLKREMKDMDSEIFKKFYESRSDDYRKTLDPLVFNLLSQYNLKLRGGGSLYHPEDMNANQG